MDKRSFIKKAGIAADVLMYLILMVQMLYVFTGNIIHEWLGIGFFLCLIVHIILKRKVIAGMWKGGKKSAARRFSDIVTVLLFLCIIVLMLSSMGVSRLLFPWFRFMGSSDFHRYMATAVLTLAVVHGGMHGFIRTKKKKTAALLIAAGAATSIAIGLALVPYMNRHFRTVTVDRSQAVEGEKVEWSGSKPLAVYFTRVGNTDFEEDVDAVSGASLMLCDGELTGSNRLIAEMVCNALDCDMKAINVTGEKYPSSYGDTVSVAGKELRSNARPDIEPVNVSGYDSIILVYPIWWGTVPMPVATFLESTDLSGKHIYLIATQGSSGFVKSTEDIRGMAEGAEVTEVVSIYCDDIPTARQTIADELKKISG